MEQGGREGWGGSWRTSPGRQNPLHLNHNRNGSVCCLMPKAQLSTQVCQSRIQSSLSRSVLIWLPQVWGSYPGAAPWNCFLVKKIHWNELGKEQPGLSLQLPSFDLSHPFQLELFCASLTRKKDIKPQIFYSLMLARCPGSAPGEKAEQAFPAVSVSSWFHILTAVIIKCSQNGFWGTRCCQEPPRVLSEPLATRTELGGEGFAQPRILSWECPEAPLRTENCTGEAHGTSGI